MKAMKGRVERAEAAWRASRPSVGVGVGVGVGCASLDLAAGTGWVRGSCVVIDLGGGRSWVLCEHCGRGFTGVVERHADGLHLREARPEAGRFPLPPHPAEPVP